MSELNNPLGQQDAAPTVPLGAGGLLKQAREAAGLHVAALAVALKVPVKRIEELENEDWNALPSAVFARGLASSVCRQLKIDPQPILQLMPQSVSRMNMDGSGFQQPLTNNMQVSKALDASHSNGWIKWGVGALVLGAVLLFAWPALQNQFPGMARWSDRANKAPAADTIAAPSVESAPLVAAVQMVPSEAVASGTVTAANPVDAANPASAPVAVPVVTPTAVTPAEAAPAATVAAGEAALTIQTPEKSWVTVRDADRKVVFEKAVPAGQSVQVSGAAPLSVVIGRGDVAQVTVKGQPFDLKPFTKGSVARFKVE